MTKFEYLIIKHNYRFNKISDLEKRLNDLGSQGWELASCIEKSSSFLAILIKAK